MPASSSLMALQTLDQLPLRQWATVQDLAVAQGDNAAVAQGADALRLRLSEIGFVPGEQVCVMAAGMPGREPLAVRVGRSTFALRRREAALIQVVSDHA